MKYEAIIGLETHVELKTDSKMFCGCSTKFGSLPNTNICPICIGMPGILPVLNKKVLLLAVKAGLALNCNIATYSKFDRKHYYYPDIPKNFQISQYDLPIACSGWINIKVDNKIKKIGITRIHMEEDAGKLVHKGNIIISDETYIDYNRGGIPLIEIVSEPDIRSAQEAKAYLEKLKNILQYINISDCKMEEGSFRCDANVSVKLIGQEKFGTKIELKNLNSFKSIQDGIEYEVERQIKILQEKGKIFQETRSFDESKGVTLLLRMKENVSDYRYLSEPDLPPLKLEKDFIENIKGQIPELAESRLKRLVNDDGLSEYDASIIIGDLAFAKYYDRLRKLGCNPKSAVNWLIGELLRLCNTTNIKISESRISAEKLGELIFLIEKGKISLNIGKIVIKEMWNSQKSAQEIINEKKLEQISDEKTMLKIVEEVIKNNSKSVDDYKMGKEKAIGFLIGQIMKQTNGRANPEMVNKLLKERL